MDWESFNGAMFGGVIASLAGAVTTLLLTEKSEEKRAKAVSEKAKGALYAELSDLASELEEIIGTFYTVYAKYKAFELFGDSGKYLSSVTMPRTINLEIMRSLMESCYSDLTKEQRYTLKALFYINEKISELYPKTLNDVRFNRQEVNVRDIHVLLSCFCACYHNVNDLSLQKERFKLIEKEPRVVLKDVLVSQGYSLDQQYLIEHAEKNVA